MYLKRWHLIAKMLKKVFFPVANFHLPPPPPLQILARNNGRRQKSGKIISFTPFSNDYRRPNSVYKLTGWKLTRVCGICVDICYDIWSLLILVWRKYKSSVGRFIFDNCFVSGGFMVWMCRSIVVLKLCAFDEAHSICVTVRCDVPRFGFGILQKNTVQYCKRRFRWSDVAVRFSYAIYLARTTH